VAKSVPHRNPERPDPSTDGGREPAAEPRRALLDAAIALLAERGTYGVSLREVAKRAGVNYGLVHYYFATKHDLLREALGRAVSGRPEALSRTVWGPRIIEHPPSDTTVRAVFHLALDWDNYGEVFAGSPVVTRRLQRLREMYGDQADDVRLRAAYAASFCLQMAWLVLAPQQLAAVNASPQHEGEFADFIKEVVRSILPLALRPAPKRAARRDVEPVSKPRAATTRPPDARDALLDAGIALLAERGTHGVSSRAIAKRAGVNYGLVYYYFATKSELLAQALRLELSRYLDGSTTDDEWQASLIDRPPADTTWRSFVHLALDWESHGDAFDSFSHIANARMRQLRATYADVDELRLRAAYIASLCLQIGWLVLAPQQLAATDASADEEAVFRDFISEVDELILDVARRPPSDREVG
jgi:TetR/AcrR family transcriptional regulator, repressor for neighboring sulfatase